MLAGDTSAELIAHALERSPKELLPSLRDLSERGWITLSRPSQVKWRQPLMGEVVLSTLQATRRKVILRRILPVLSRMPTNKALIQLLLDTGHAKLALERTITWVERQLAEGRPLTALDLLETVMHEVDKSDDLDQAQKAALYLSLIHI